jgi:hypothetical protein
MPELIHTHSTQLQEADGTIYDVHTFAKEREDGTWIGWIEFHPRVEGKGILRTGQETSQPSREAVEYWATGIETVYLEGAFARAREA